MQIESERLVLRPWTHSDFDAFAEYHADPKLAQFVGGVCERPEAWRRFAAIIGHWQLRGFGFWALEEKKSADFVGCCGLWYPEGWPELEVGYWLMPSAQGSGFATEAARRSIDFALNHLQADSLVSYIAPENEPSIRVAERLGAGFTETIELGSHGPHRVYRHK